MAHDVTTAGPDQYGRVVLYVDGEIVATVTRTDWATAPPAEPGRHE